MTKIVYSSCFGGFGLSAKAIARYNEIKGAAVRVPGSWDIERTDPALVQVVEELEAEANGEFADLTITELDEGTRYRIVECNGAERVETEDLIDWLIA